MTGDTSTAKPLATEPIEPTMPLVHDDATLSGLGFKAEENSINLVTTCKAEKEVPALSAASSASSSAPSVSSNSPSPSQSPPQQSAASTIYSAPPKTPVIGTPTLLHTSHNLYYHSNNNTSSTVSTPTTPFNALNLNVNTPALAAAIAMPPLTAEDVAQLAELQFGNAHTRRWTVAGDESFAHGMSRWNMMTGAGPIPMGTPSMHPTYPEYPYHQPSLMSHMVAQMPYYWSGMAPASTGIPSGSYDNFAGLRRDGASYIPAYYAPPLPQPGYHHPLHHQPALHPAQYAAMSRSMMSMNHGAIAVPVAGPNDNASPVIAPSLSSSSSPTMSTAASSPQSHSAGAAGGARVKPPPLNMNLIRQPEVSMHSLL